MRAALIVVDVQNDFMPGGALAVPEGDRVVAPLNGYIRRFVAAGRPVYATRDWHPPVTKHFQAWGGLWPPHCVQGTPGAEFHQGLRLPAGVAVASIKGEDPDEADAYSGFAARAPDGQGIADLLRALGCDHVFVGGLATDYCVKATVLDALAAGFGATFLTDASLGVNLGPHDSEDAIAEMVRSGAGLATLERLRIQG